MGVFILRTVSCQNRKIRYATKLYINLYFYKVPDFFFCNFYVIEFSLSSYMHTKQNILAFE